MKKYIKLCKNPLGLKSVTIVDNEFTDEKLDERAKGVLQLALKGGLVKEVEAFDSEGASNENTTDNQEIEVLQGKLTDAETHVKELQDVVIAKDLLQGKLVEIIGYKSMDAETLAKEFTVDELKVFAELEGVEVKSADKEAAIAKKIVEAGK